MKQGTYPYLKHALDRILATILFVVTLPLVLLSALAIRLTTAGPAFYAQNRVGLNGTTFQMYKLRTMPRGSEATTGPVWSPPDDPRVTPIGRILRQWHVDELPQLVNVMLGHMSLIGPRPERPELCAQIEKQLPRFRERHQVRPGLTGLAQVRVPTARNIGMVRHKLAADLDYIAGMCPSLDARILRDTALYLARATRGTSAVPTEFSPAER
jgi:lipopolysaccharide/colanic/teichoic acid biosynthesis glycosyltransferase